MSSFELEGIGPPEISTGPSDDDSDGTFAFTYSGGEGEADSGESLEADGDDARFGVDDDTPADVRGDLTGSRSNSAGHQDDELTQGRVNELFADIASSEQGIENGGVRDIQRPDGTREQHFDAPDGTEVSLYSHGGGSRPHDPDSFNADLQARHGRTDEEQAQFYENHLAAEARLEAARAEDRKARTEEPGSDRQLEALRELEQAKDGVLASGNILLFNDAEPIVRQYAGETWINGVVTANDVAPEAGDPTAATTSGAENSEDSELTGSGKTPGTVRAIGRLAAEDPGQQITDSGERSALGERGPDRALAAPAIEALLLGDRDVDSERSSATTEGERARLQQLERLPHNGFTNREIADVRGQIAAIGYSVDNFKVFNHKENERGTEDTIASWLGHGHGEFTVYDLYDKQIPEKRLGTLAHESSHANSPLKPENARVFGGEEDQEKAVRYIDAVARQSLETGIHLNGYHKYLMNEYTTNMSTLWNAFEGGEVNANDFEAAQAEASRKFREETWAIMNEMALTNRAGLMDVQARQHKAMDKQPHKIDLISDPNSRDQQASSGIDAWLVKLLDGVNNQQELVQHVASLKQRFYGEANNQIARQRAKHDYATAA